MAIFRFRKPILGLLIALGVCGPLAAQAGEMQGAGQAGDIVQADAAPGSSRSRNEQELGRVDSLLAADQHAFNGFNKSSSLAEIRGEIDRLRRVWMEKEMMAAENDAQRAEIAERHKAYWHRVEANRAEREDAPLAVNINHGLMMIYRNKKKAEF